MALSPRTNILIRDRIQFTPRREEGHVKTKGRDGSDEDRRYADSYPKAPTAGGGLKTALLRASRGCTARLTPGFQTSAFLNCQEVLSVLSLSRQFVVIYYRSIKKLVSLHLQSSSHFLPYNLEQNIKALWESINFISIN